MVPAPPPPRASEHTPARTPLTRRLLQLSLVLVAAAVVLAVGVPLAHEHALRQYRREATSALEHIQAAEEAYFVEHGHYAAALSQAPPQGLGLPARSARGHYGLSVEVTQGPAGPSFFTEARNLRAGADSRCVRFSLNREGVRGAQDANGRDHTDDCWR
ncbi:MAG TPA: type IV pilin protein [Steroidobacteraceae bacterium]|nr:type IV pilin protein [Steroidobacteraceae bacterium]